MLSTFVLYIQWKNFLRQPPENRTKRKKAMLHCTHISARAYISSSQLTRKKAKMKQIDGRNWNKNHTRFNNTECDRVLCKPPSTRAQTQKILWQTIQWALSSHSFFLRYVSICAEWNGCVCVYVCLFAFVCWIGLDWIGLVGYAVLCDDSNGFAYIHEPNTLSDPLKRM